MQWFKLTGWHAADDTDWKQPLTLVETKQTFDTAQRQLQQAL